MLIEEYREYLKSEDWKERRKEMLDEAGHVCEDCGMYANLLHHLNYDNLGIEELYNDVLPLCHNCHMERHGKSDEYGDYGV